MTEVSFHMNLKKVSLWRQSAAAFLLAVVALTGFGCLEAGAYTRYWHQKSTLYDKLSLRPGDIVFFGNSITDGGEFDELFGNEKVKNRGISGDVVAGLRERLHQAVDNGPSKIFILIGINDIANGLSPAEIAAQYDLLLAEMRRAAPRTEIYVQSVMPIDNDFQVYGRLNGKEALVTELNALLEPLAAKHGAVYVDLWPALADPATGKIKKEFTNDGLHLLGAGYKAWAAAIDGMVNGTETTKK